MKNKKTTLVLALTALIAVSACAQQYDDESDFVAEREGLTGVVITGYRGSKREVRIPPRIQNLPVTSIGEAAFLGCTGLASVTFDGTIPSSGFSSTLFPGDLRDKFYATDEDNGTPGTYTRAGGSNTWTNQDLPSPARRRL